jgi:di/tricarboxylate transporter
VGLWIFGGMLNVDAVTAAILGLSVLLVTGVVTWKECLAEAVAWDTLTWFAALIAMAGYLNKYGLISWFSQTVVKVCVSLLLVSHCAWLFPIISECLYLLYTSVALLHVDMHRRKKKDFKEQTSQQDECKRELVNFNIALELSMDHGVLAVNYLHFLQFVGGLGLSWQLSFGILVLLYFYSHYFFASGAAHIGAMFTAFLSVASALGTPPYFGAMVLAFLSNLMGGLTHYGIGSAPIFYGANYVPLAKWWGYGFLISVVNIIIWLGVGGVWWKAIGLW